MTLMSADSVAADQIRAFVERIERLEEERTSIARDIAEVYAEAKGNGFDRKALKIVVTRRRQDHNERMELEALVELYEAALMGFSAGDYEEVGTVVATRAPARASREDQPEHDPATKAKRSAALDALAAMDAEIIDAETGEVIEPQHGLRADTAAQTVQPHAAVADSEALPEAVESSVGGEGDGNPLPVSHSSSQAIEGLSSPFTRHGWATSSAGTEGEADRQPIPEALGSHPTNALSLVAATRKDADTAAPEADHSKPNPICRDPDDCGVYASWHLPCRACLKAAEAAA